MLASSNSVLGVQPKFDELGYNLASYNLSPTWKAADIQKREVHSEIYSRHKPLAWLFEAIIFGIDCESAPTFSRRN